MLVLVLFLLSVSYLVESQTVSGNFTVLLFSDIGNKTIVANNVANKYFIRNTSKFDCSLNRLYTYTQTDALYTQNAFYSIVISGLDTWVNVSISTVHNNFQPSYSLSNCTAPECQIWIQNNCPGSINFFNYFDRIVLKISGYDNELTYYVKCDDQFVANTF